MGSSDTDKPAKEPITASPTTAPEQSTVTSTAAVNAEWSGFQAYSPIPPPGFMASNPQAHPYVWGVQHMMPPYGAPPHPYVAMYPHGGVYAHPTMPPGSYPFPPFAIPSPNGMVEATGNNTHGSADADAKPPEGKDKLPVKRMRGSLGSLNMMNGQSNEEGKTGAVANGGGTKSAESGSDGSSEGSDADSQNDLPTKSGGRLEVGEAIVSQNGNSTHATQNGVVNVPLTMVNHAMPVVPMAGPGPATNLNIGMDYWGVPASSPIPAVQGHVSASIAAGMVSAGSHDNLQSKLWLQDERELKRQRRKQSNRESARRSRLRKQAECDELAQHAEVLQQENANLRSELSRIRNDYGHLITENNKLKERLGETPEGLGSSDAELRLANETQESVKTTD